MTARVIAIDGPAASGKSSTAAGVANALGWLHLDSGALYRALTWIAVERAREDAEEILQAAADARIHLVAGATETTVRAGNRELDDELRTAGVTARVSAVAAMPQVRHWINARIREAVAATSGAVIDGRDIGTVVVPDAALKVFLTATPEVRARRRLLQRGDAIDPGELARETARLVERDRLDAGRRIAPLRQAEDAIALDTSLMSFDEQVRAIVGFATRRGLAGTEDRGPAPA